MSDDEAPSPLGKDIAAISPDGRLVTIGRDQAEAAFAQGYKPANDAQTQHVERSIAHGEGLGNTLAATGLGAARGLSFGLSDAALAGTGLVEGETLRDYQEQHGLASGVGEAAGIAGGLALGGALGAGVKGVAALGEGAGALAARGLTAAGLEGTGLGARVAAKALQAGVSGAVEGGFYGLGQGVSHVATEAELGDPGEVAQQLLAHAGMGILLGGGLGAALGGTQVLGGAAKRAFARRIGIGGESLADAEASRLAAGKATIDAGPSVGDAAEAADSMNAAGATATPTAAAAPTAAEPGLLRKGLAKLGNIVSGADEQTLREALETGAAGREVREAARGGVEAADADIRAVTKHVNDIEANTRSVMDQTRGEMKVERVKQIIKTGNEVEQADAALGEISKARKMVEHFRDETYADGYKSGLNRFSKAIDAAEAKINGARNAGEDVGVKSFIAIDELKRAMGSLAKPGGVASTVDAPVVQGFRDFYNTNFQPMLENTQLWGDAGRVQKQLNKKWVALLDKADHFESNFLTRHGRDAEQASWAVRRVADPEKISGYLQNIGRAKNDLKQAVMTEHSQAVRDFAEAARDLYDIKGEVAPRVDKIIQGHDALQADLKRVLRDAGIRSEARKILATKTGRVLGAASDGVDVVSRALGIGQKEAGVVGVTEARNQHIGAMRQAAQKTTKTVSSGVSAFVKKLGDAPKLGVPLGTTTALHQMRFTKPSGRRNASPDPDTARQDSNEGRTFRRHLGELARLSANPADMVDLLDASTGHLRATAPRIAAELQLTASRGVAYLQQVAPKNPDFDSIPELRRAWQPSAEELRKFNAAAKAVVDPMSVVRDLEHGTLRREGVEALQHVYPHLYQQIASELIPKVAESEHVPLQRRLEIGDLFGVTTDAIASPQLGAMMAQAYAQPPQQPPQPRPGVPKNTAATQSMTAMQRATEGA